MDLVGKLLNTESMNLSILENLYFLHLLIEVTLTEISAEVLQFSAVENNCSKQQAFVYH